MRHGGDFRAETIFYGRGNAGIFEEKSLYSHLLRILACGIDVRGLVLKMGLAAVMVLSVLLLDLPLVHAAVMEMDWQSPTTYSLSSVFMISSSDGWAVGYPGTIIHWNGTDWSNVTSPTTEFLWSVFMVSNDDGWAVGNEGIMIRWDGNNWTTFASRTSQPLSSVFMLSAVDGWAVGWLGTIVHWDGSSWRTVTSPTTQPLGSVFMTNSTDG